MSSAVLDSPLRRKVRSSCGKSPGVYRWLCRGEPIYVGRSRSLRQRLLSYFRAPEGSKAALIVAAADDLVWEETSSEFESHLTELRLIKQIRPARNWALKNDRDYVFIKVGLGPAPRLTLSREPTPYGPFRSPRRVADALRRLSDILQLRTSPETTPLLDPRQLPLFSIPRRPLCLRGEIGFCSAPCAGGISFSDYAHRIDRARQFLLGQETELLDDLRSRMREASQRMEFERASVYRDRLKELEALSHALSSLRESLDRLTFVYAVPGIDGRDRLYFLKGGRVFGDLPRCRDPRQIERARELAAQLLGPISPPASGDEMDEIRVVAGWFRTHPEELGRTMPPDTFLQDPKRWPSSTPEFSAPRVALPGAALLHDGGG
ncbi:MAG: UvrB/UvrC motif-containing protein [Myxococcales bacterium]|nr:UvrB/UvrC motif-containing protein [Polyangiaceae bacterium]MDW8250393.1 UvrB/UvrC motif-containing protein [Myxococcales bacterium]